MVDDDPTTLEFVKKFLERAGYTRWVATTNSREALSLIAREQPDIVLLDLIMPGVNGFEILAGIRGSETARYTPVIVLTAETNPDAQLRALELGATDFLTKPVNPAELRLRVRNALAFKAYQDRLADFDGLTGLVNRSKFTAHLKAALADGGQEERSCALLHMDLDRFKSINETFGHRAGDKLLCAVAERMQIVLADYEVSGWPPVRSEDLKTNLARIGGNGFAAILPNLHALTKLEKTTSVARSLLAALAEPFGVEKQALSVTASIGIAVSPDDGEDADVLMKNAETAMYQAKQRGRHTYEFFSGEMKARAQERITLESQVREAVERKEFLLYFQPKVALEAQRITGAEALIRWRRPGMGIVTPDKFISIAEETGSAIDIGRWSLTAACQQLADWMKLGLPPLEIAVNIASVQCQRGMILEAVQEALASSGLPAEQLVLELSEKALMENPERSLGLMYELKELGVRLALNDFCMHGVSISVLSQFPIEEVKISRTFLAGAPQQKDKAVVLSAICALAKELGFKATAVGVETQEQLSFLRNHHCQFYQGYVFSRAAPAEAFVNLVRRSI
jgi:diguanylate cyclase (GGDEF)-like protein